MCPSVGGVGEIDRRRAASTAQGATMSFTLGAHRGLGSPTSGQPDTQSIERRLRPACLRQRVADGPPRADRDPHGCGRRGRNNRLGALHHTNDLRRLGRWPAGSDAPTVGGRHVQRRAAALRNLGSATRRGLIYRELLRAIQCIRAGRATQTQQGLHDEACKDGDAPEHGSFRHDVFGPRSRRLDQPMVLPTGVSGSAGPGYAVRGGRNVRTERSGPGVGETTRGATLCAGAGRSQISCWEAREHGP